MIASRYQAWLQAGDPAQLEPELAGLLPILRQRARRILGRDQDADDAVQEVCLELLRTRERLPAHLPLGAITGRLLHERALMALRSRRRREHGQVQLDETITCASEVADDGLAEALAGIAPEDRALVEVLTAGTPRWRLNQEQRRRLRRLGRALQAAVA